MSLTIDKRAHIPTTFACSPPYLVLTRSYSGFPTRDRKAASSNPGNSGGKKKKKKSFSPELTLCADSYSVSVPPSCYRSGTEKTPIILLKVQMAGYT